jgi:hypothetical protein
MNTILTPIHKTSSLSYTLLYQFDYCYNNYTMSCRGRLTKRFTKQEARSKAVEAAMIQNNDLLRQKRSLVLLSSSSSSSNRYHRSNSTSTVCTRELSSLSLSSSCSSTSLKSGNSVSFGSIEVREYNRLTEDWFVHDVPTGLALGWDYVQRVPVPIDDVDDSNQEQQHHHHRQKQSEVHSNAVDSYDRYGSSSTTSHRKVPTILQRVMMGRCISKANSSLSTSSSSSSLSSTTAGKGNSNTSSNKGKNGQRNSNSNYRNNQLQPKTLQQRIEILQQFGCTEEELAYSRN